MVNNNASNERNMNRTLKAILLSAGLCSLPSLCFSAIVYDNPSSPTPTQYFPPTPTLEFGDEITLTTANTTDRILSRFDFEYFFSGASVTAQSVTVRLYANTGVGNSPSTTPLYTSDPIPLSTGANGYNSQPIIIDTALRTITLPEDFTWTVEFSNLGAGETGGLLLHSPPTVGTSFNQFWQRDAAGAWISMQSGVGFNDFAARVTAVPEPGVLALGGLGALLLAGLGRFRKAPG